MPRAGVTLHKARNADFMGTTAISGAAAETVIVGGNAEVAGTSAQLMPPPQ
jgi:hypothetical protein